jgi:hypothetical protein
MRQQEKGISFEEQPLVARLPHDGDDTGDTLVDRRRQGQSDDDIEAACAGTAFKDPVLLADTYCAEGWTCAASSKSSGRG